MFEHITHTLPAALHDHVNAAYIIELLADLLAVKSAQVQQLCCWKEQLLKGLVLLMLAGVQCPVLQLLASAEQPGAAAVLASAQLAAALAD